MDLHPNGSGRGARIRRVLDRIGGPQDLDDGGPDQGSHVHRTGIPADVEAREREERGQVGQRRRVRSDPSGAARGGDDGCREGAVIASGTAADHRGDPLPIGQGPRHRGVAGHRVALVGRGVAGSRVDRDRCRPRPQGLPHPLEGLRIQAQRPRVGIRLEGQEAHQSLVSLEAADPPRIDPGAIGREQECQLAGEGTRVGDASARPGETPQDSALQNRVEVEDQIEVVGPKLPEEAAGDPPGAHQVPSPQRVPERTPGKQDHLVDPGLPLHDARGGGLEQPGDVGAGVGTAQGGDRGKRSHHVAHGSEANHENPIGLREVGEWIRAGGDDEPRGGGFPRVG